MESETNYTNKIVIVDFATGETTEREMTEQELADASPISTDPADA
jgi:hypothetical protein